MNFGKSIFNFQPYEGATHFDDIGYIFKTAYLPAPLYKSSKGYDAMRKIVKYYTSFATDGNPNSKCPDEVAFEPSDERYAPIKCFILSEECKMSILPQTDKFVIWDSIFEEENLPVY
jgi:carboxylesterase type B